MELHEARRLVLESAVPCSSESVPIGEAMGRVLSESLQAQSDLPPLPRSRLDGFAVRSCDTHGASAGRRKSLRLVPGCLAAGYVPSVSLSEGQSVQILTGAPVPANADAVVGFEEVVREGEWIAVARAIRVHEGISLPGEEIKAGEIVLSRGRVLTPTRLAMLAALGHASVTVRARPRVALLSTGDEVRELGETLEGPLTTCNNRLLLGWMTVQQGGVPVHLGVARDDTREIAKALSFREAEVVVTTGGVGRGERDFILRAWEERGIQLHFREINLIPGKNSAFGTDENRLYFALPGNPWGAQVVFGELVVPLLHRLHGLEHPERPRVKARLSQSIRKKEGYFSAVRGNLNFEGAFPSFQPVGQKGSSLFADLLEGSAYVLLEPHVTRLPAAAEVSVFFPDFPLSAYPLLLSPSLC